MDSDCHEHIFLDDYFKGGAAVSLVRMDVNGTMQLSTEAATVIKSLTSPIGIISIVGKIKTGKSFLLNRLILDMEGGFSVGSNVDPCTKGLWIWNRPLRRRLPSGKVLNILVIDTQGMGSSESNAEQDLNILALSVLISSYMIYNSFGHIDEASISSLSLVAELTRIIDMKSSRKDEPEPVSSTDRTPFFMCVQPFQHAIRNSPAEQFDCAFAPAQDVVTFLIAQVDSARLCAATCRRA